MGQRIRTIAGALCLTAAMVASCQPSLTLPAPEHKHKKKQDAPKSGPRPSQEPAFTIPVTPLGFAPPAAFYLGRRVAQVSLGFLDEGHLLFTFHVPGLIPRGTESPGEELGQDRRIRALVLALPAGQITAEALWTVHDQRRYLWMLQNGHFLLRDRNLVQRGDAGLTLEPFLRFPGAVDFLELDPSQKLLVTDTKEPQPGANAKLAAVASDASTPGTPASAAATVTSDEDSAPQASQALLRILRMDSRKVELFSRVNSTIHLPVDGDGYYEALRSSGQSWEITHQSFRGSAALLSRVDSVCSPVLEAVSAGVVLVTSCQSNGQTRLTILTQRQQRLWELSSAPTHVWPVLEVMPQSGRFARSTLEISRPVGANSPIDFDELRGQEVQVYDLATGNVVLSAPASPILDGGGNFALSPSGRRAAVLNDGAIQVFELPPAPPIPSPSGH